MPLKECSTDGKAHLEFKGIAQVAQVRHGGYVPAKEDAKIKPCRIGMIKLHPFLGTKIKTIIGQNLN